MTNLSELRAALVEYKAAVKKWAEACDAGENDPPTAEFKVLDFDRTQAWNKWCQLTNPEEMETLLELPPPAIMIGGFEGE